MMFRNIRIVTQVLTIASLFGCSSNEPDSSNPASLPNPDLVITNARLFSGKDQSVTEFATIVIDDNRISAVTTGELTGKTVIDAQGRTVMPGLIEGHAHNYFDFEFSDSEFIGVNFPANEEELKSYVSGRMRDKFDDQLRAGITSSMSAGAFWPYVTDLKKMLENGEMRGPRLFVSGGIFTAPNGHPAVGICGGSEFCANHVAVQVDDEEAAREWVRRYFESGVDQIKITYVEPDGPKLRPEIVMAIIDEAHSHELRVLAHVMDAADVPSMLAWGIDGFVHPPGLTLDEDGSLLRAASEKGLPLSITFGSTGIQIEGPEVDNLSATDRGFSENELREYFITKENVVKMIEMGAVPVFGSDMPGSPTADVVNTVTWALSEIGLSNAEVLLASTRNVAHKLIAQPDLGTIETGKLADLIVVDGDPLTDLSALANVDIVIQNGKIVVNKE